MAPVQLQKVETVADLVRRLGDIPLERIRLHPFPGTATEKDLLAACDGPDKTLCELIDGTLVEKPMGAMESFLAATLIRYLGMFVDQVDFGAVFGSDGPFRILPRRIRLPDVSVVSWDKMPNREVPDQAISTLIPDLIVEVISKGNTKKEMERKLHEYFEAGVRQAWLIYPKSRSARIYTEATQFETVTGDQSLTGGDVLPGFELPLPRLFAKAAQPMRKKRKS
jgi:Uma2 family endonuclease